MAKVVSESRFYMWRAVFAMAHADGVVTSEERELLNEFLTSNNFTDEQREVLVRDIDTPQKVHEMFANITDQSDRNQFFYFARLIVWCDGDFDRQERVIMEKLKTYNLEALDIEEVSSGIKESADATAEALKDGNIKEGGKKSFWSALKKLIKGGDDS